MVMAGTRSAKTMGLEKEKAKRFLLQLVLMLMRAADYSKIYERLDFLLCASMRVKTMY